MTAKFKVDDLVTSTQVTGVGCVRDAVQDTDGYWRYTVEFGGAVRTQMEDVLTLSSEPPSPPMPASADLVLFDHENRLRSMEGAPPLSLAEFMTKMR